MHHPPSWVDPLMRFGFIARGIVYVLVGAMAFLASMDGSPTPNSKSALALLLNKPFGKVLLLLVAVGLLAYALWTFIDVALDLDDKGGDTKGLTARTAIAISGAIHLGLAVSVMLLVLGRGTQDGDSTDHWTAILMRQPFGRWIVAIVGMIAVAVGVQHFIKAKRGQYKKELRYTTVSSRLDPLLKLGLVAHGLVVALIGWFFMWAAWTANPARAGGMREALSLVRSTEGGPVLLAIVSTGLVGFAVYCFIVAAYRIVPRCAPQDLQTLASKAREMMNTRVSTT